MQVIKYLQLPFFFDAPRMLEEVNILSNAQWQLHYQKMDYEGEWTALPLRSIGGDAEHVIVMPDATSHYQDTVFLKESVYLKEVLSFFKCPLRTVRLLKLQAGAIIKEHRDRELNFEKGEVRIHIPVITHPDVEFYLDGERMQPKEGECWYMNFNLPHSIHNKSTVNRVHLVIDAEVNDWVKEQFDRNDLLAKKTVEEKDPYDVETKKIMIQRFREMNTPKGHELADKLEKEIAASLQPEESKQ
jgi:hypothetical protein